MDSYKETFETWNKVALLYQEKFMNLDIYNETYDLFCNAIAKDNAKILEIGCGPGNITKYILSEQPNYRIDGIDFSPNMIELAKKNNPTASFRVMDCRQIEKIDKIFDGIICGFCLPYISEVESLKLISDAFNLLDEDGLLYISFVEGDPADSGFKSASTGDRTYFYNHDLNKISQQLLETGFTKPQIFRVNYESVNSKKEQHTILLSSKNTHT